MFFSKQFKDEQKRLKMLLILNRYKNIFENFVNSLDIKCRAIPKQFDLPNHNILDSKDNLRNLEVENKLSNRL